MAPSPSIGRVALQHLVSLINTNTPYEAVFGHHPPSLLDYTEGSATITVVNELLHNRGHVLNTVKQNL